MFNVFDSIARQVGFHTNAEQLIGDVNKDIWDFNANIEDPKQEKIKKIYQSKLHEAPKGIFHNEFYAYGNSLDPIKEFYEKLGLNCTVRTRKPGKQGEHQVCSMNFFGQENIAILAKGKKQPEKPKIGEDMAVYPHWGITLEDGIHYQQLLDNICDNDIPLLDVDENTGIIKAYEDGKETVQYRKDDSGNVKQRMIYIMDPSNNIIHIKWCPTPEDRPMHSTPNQSLAA